MATISTFPAGMPLGDRYVIQRVIGQGGMGVVYLALDRQLRDEPRAIKAIKAELLSSPKAAMQLKNEAIASIRLAHPNIVRVLNYEEWEGAAYIVMEYVEGRTLEELLADKGRVVGEEFLGIARQACAALGYAHEKGIIHQDVKPANIFVDKAGVVKLADFGIARVAKDTTTRMTGQMPSGTIAYMSPELLRGEKPTAASDIYSLGVTFYEMLSGDPPFARGDIYRQHQERVPEPIAGAPESLDRAVQSMLAKDPTRRPRDVRACLELLEGAAARAEKERLEAERLEREKREAEGVAIGFSRSTPATGAAANRPAKAGRYNNLADHAVGQEEEQRREAEHVAIGFSRSTPATGAADVRPAKAGRYNNLADQAVGPEEEQRREAEHVAIGFSRSTPATGAADVRPAKAGRYNNLADQAVGQEEERRRQAAPVQRARERAGYFGRRMLVYGSIVMGLIFVALLIFFMQSSRSSFSGFRSSGEDKQDKPAREEPSERQAEEQRQATARAREEGSAYEIARSADSIVAWRAFLERFPDYSRASDVRTRISELEAAEKRADDQRREESAYQQAKNADTKAAWEGFLRNYPGSSHATEARLRISEIEEASRVTEARESDYLKTSLGSGVELRLRLIPAGSFTMGSPSSESGRDGDEGPQHRVEISKPFYIGVYEVTQEQWQRVMGNNPSNFKGADRPVERVSWNDAVEFCRKLSNMTGEKYRLPTEAEWEYACRAGTTTAYYWGNSVDGNYAWYDANSGSQTHDVGGKQPNAWGLYDMSGNVWEWCQDSYDSDYYKNSPRQDPPGPSSGGSRVYRGGCWYYVCRGLRSSSRYDVTPDYRYFSSGFRIARDER